MKKKNERKSVWVFYVEVISETFCHFSFNPITHNFRWAKPIEISDLKWGHHHEKFTIEKHLKSFPKKKQPRRFQFIASRWQMWVNLKWEKWSEPFVTSRPKIEPIWTEKKEIRSGVKVIRWKARSSNVILNGPQHQTSTHNQPIRPKTFFQRPKFFFLENNWKNKLKTIQSKIDFFFGGSMPFVGIFEFAKSCKTD